MSFLVRSRLRCGLHVLLLALPALAFGQDHTTEQRLNPLGGPTAPDVVITSVTRQYPGFYLDGVALGNRFDINVNWAGRTPNYVFYSANSNPPGFGNIPANAAGASHVFNLQDFPAATSPTIFRMHAVTGQGCPYCLYGPDHFEAVYKFPRPLWLASAFATNADVLKFSTSGGEIKAEIKKNFPDSPLQRIILFPPEVPYIGGEFGLTETQATFTGNASSTGLGSISLSGKTGFKALNGSLSGTISGSGSFRLFPPDGLILQSTSFGLGISGTLEREVTLLQAIPSLDLALLESVPVLGSGIRWVNSHAKVKGEITPSLSFTANFEQQSGDLAFKEGLGKLGCDLKATLKISVIKDTLECKAWVAGSGSFTLGVPVNDANPLLRGGEIKFETGAEFTISALINVNYKATYQASCTYAPATGIACGTKTGNANPVSAMVAAEHGEIDIIEPAYERFGAYSEFAPVTLAPARSPQVPLTVNETVLVTNVFKGASPHLVELSGGKRLLLFVRQDPADPALQSTDIAWSLFDGTSWSAPAVIVNDTRVELGPVAAVDSSGKVVAAWTRIKDAAFSTPITQASELPQFYTRLEVVSATFDPLTSTWSPITQLTDDSAFDSNVSISGDASGNLLMSWLSNSAGEFVSTSSNPSTLKYSTWTGTTWTTPANIATGLAGVHSHAAARRGMSAFVILPRDPDLAAANDGVLDLFTWNGTAWSGPSTFAAGGTENRLPDVVYDGSGIGHVIWVRGNDLVHATLAALTPQTVRTGSASLSFYETRLMVNAAGNLTLLRQESLDNDGAEIVATIYDSSSNSWSADRRLTQSSASATSLDAVFGTDGGIYGTYLSTAITRTSKTVTINGQDVTIDNIPGDGRTDLLVFGHTLITDLATSDRDLQLEPGFPRQGDSVTATVNVYNAGDFATGSFNVKVYLGYPEQGGVLAGTAPIDGPFRAGERRQLSFTFPYASGVRDVVAVLDADGMVMEFAETNNRAIVRLASNAAPTARIVASVLTGAAPLQVGFDATSSVDPNGDPVQYQWAFSDGTLSASGTTVMHTFTQDGVFPVVLTVTDVHGAVGTASVQITVGGTIPAITALSPTSGLVGTMVGITGANLTGATSVTFAGTTAAFTVAGPNQITATVPSGAVSGSVKVTTPGGTATSPMAFTVLTVTVRGDANSDGTRTVSDVFYLINHLFASGPAPLGSISGDANNDGTISVADVVFLLNHFFAGGSAPAP